ncbi:MAG TPA: tetratricopeptide repeat protein, partial [Gammaproteobacteria bacterium]
MTNNLVLPMPLFYKRLPITIAVFSFLCIITIALYGSINEHNFLYWDDKDYVVNNDMIKPLSVDNVISMFTKFDSANWHPITWLSYSINFAIWGDSPAAFKWTNVAIHLLNSLLIFLLTIALLGTMKTSNESGIRFNGPLIDFRCAAQGIIAGLIFAIHPQHVESVVWVSDRKDLLCTFFFLSALLAYIYSFYSNKKTTWNHIVLILFAFSLMSKSIAVTLPVVLSIVDILVLKTVNLTQTKWRIIQDLLKNKIALIFLSIAVSAITIITQSSQIQNVETYGMLSRVVNSSINYFYYLGSILYPDILSPYHPFPSLAINVSWASALPVTALAALSFCLFKYRNNINEMLVFAITIYSIMILPSLGVIQLAHAARADRYAYLPTFIFYVLIGVVIFEVFKKLKFQRIYLLIASVTTIGMFIYFSAATFKYVGDWKTDEYLWKKVVYQYPETAAPAYNNLGNVNYDRAQYSAAIQHYEKAIEIDPSIVAVYRNIGNAFININKLDSALKYYNLAIANNPDNPQAYEMLGDYYYKKNDFAT